MACHDRGGLQRVSVIVNGVGWDHAVAELRKRPRLAVALHLNLFEGAALSPPSEVDLLVNSRGRFHGRLATLCARGVAGPTARRLKAQIRLELRRQIERFVDAFADRGPLIVDGHLHWHVMPPVFHEVMTLCAEYPVAGFRLPREPFYWPRTAGAPRPPAMNIVKNVVLRVLCYWSVPAVRTRSLTSAGAFVGVLGSGVMTLAHVRAALDHLRRIGTSGRVEILFHPGRARPDETTLWSDRPELGAYYLSPNRDREAGVLCDHALAQLLRAYSAPGSDGVPIPRIEVAR